MASILKVDDLRGNTSAGDITITSEGGAATQSLQQGVAKAWINYNGTGTIATRDSFSVSSISDVGTGDTRITFSNAFNNADYVANYTNGYGASVNFNTETPTTTTARMLGFATTTGANQDRNWNLVSVHGDLA